MSGGVATVAGVPVRVAALDDIIESKRAAGRPKDTASLPVLEQTAAVLRAMGPAAGRRRE